MSISMLPTNRTSLWLWHSCIYNARLISTNLLCPLVEREHSDRHNDSRLTWYYLDSGPFLNLFPTNDEGYLTKLNPSFVKSNQVSQRGLILSRGDSDETWVTTQERCIRFNSLAGHGWISHTYTLCVWLSQALLFLLASSFVFIRNSVSWCSCTLFNFLSSVHGE